MIINRHNYEEFFLLYVDNELKPEERTEVEKFVEQHADLREELEMLRQVTLTDPNIQFENKNLLYKKEESISLNNYEEYFLLATDNELNNKQADDVEKFILKHPQLQGEYTLLQKTRLIPEPLVFDDKKVLYRKERRVIPIAWMRIAVAASVVTIIAFSWLYTINNTTNPIERNVAATRPVIGTQKNISNLVGETVTKQQVATLKNKSNFQKEPEVKATPLVVNKVKNGNKVQTVSKVTVLQTEDKKLQTTQEDVAVVKNNPEQIKNKALYSGGNTVEISGTETNTTVVYNKTNEDAVLAKHAVYNEIANNEEDNSIYIGSAELNKNKLRGLFKKAASLFDKKADSEDDDKTLRIAGFRIKSK